MRIYWLILVWSVVWILLYRPSWCIEGEVLGEKRPVVKKQHIFTSLIFLLIFIGFRGGVMDSALYTFKYASLPNTFSAILPYMEEHPTSYLFYFLSSVFKCLFSEQYYWWFFTITAISCFLMCSTLRRYSENYGVSMYLFIASTMFTWLMNGVRQFLVVCILFFVFDWFVQKKYIRLLILIFILSYMHQSALLMIPLVFIVQAKPFGKMMWLVIFASFATLLVTDTFTDILYELTKNTEYAEDWVNIQNDTGSNIFRALVAAVPMMLAFLKRREIAAFNPPHYVNICINFSVLAFGLYLFASVTSGIYIGRLPIYCEIFNLLLFPWLISVPYKSERRLYSLLFFGFYLVYFVYQMQIAWGGLYYFSNFLGIIL